MRGFVGYRPDPPQDYRERGLANAPDEAQYEGTVFSNGTVALCWLTSVNSHSIFKSWDDFHQVHGHPEYGTKIEWTDPAGADALAARVAELRETADQIRAMRITSLGDDRRQDAAEAAVNTIARAMREKADSLEHHRPQLGMPTGIVVR